MNRFALSWTRALLTVVGVLAAAALIWFVGPLVAIGGVVPLAGEPARWAALVALVVLAMAYAVWRAVGAARRNRRLMEGLVAGGAAASAPAPGENEVAVIAKRFEQAVDVLRRSRIGGKKRPWLAALSGRPYVYELPWYIIIGAPGAGKTTALVNSGLEFPLATTVGQKVIRGIGGTRNCDWWFASEAVLIDTAGRYTTHDSDRAADRAAWLGFLALLARYRPRRPINGVLLTISVSDLLNASSARRLAHAGELRERIEELHARLGIAFPVYVLITKTDLLAGFMEFFADFDKDERAQVWGVTFPYEADSTRDGPQLRMASDFAALEKRLNDCLIDQLHSERDRERRAAVYAFPQQWRVLRQTLFDFLQTMVTGMRAELRPFVRGVYFTSATQEGTPMDRALGGLTRALGLSSRILPAARPSGKTFFVTRLLRDVVFAESGLAGTNLRWRRRRAVLEWGLLGLSACTVAAAAALSWRAYADNRAYIGTLASRLPALERDVASGKAAPATDLAALLPALDSLSTFGQPSRTDGQLARAPGVPGLDRSEMLDTAAHDAYQRALRDAFLPRIAARLEGRLRAGERDHVEAIYDALKAYLMLFGGRNFDRAALRAYLVADWDATLPRSVSADQRDALRLHLDRLLAGGEVGAPSNADPQLVADARRLVASVPLAQRAYHRLKQLDLGPEAVPFTVESAGGAGARRVFVRASGQPLTSGVPALYSRAVFQQSLGERTQEVLRQFAREQGWVLATAAAGAGDPGSQKVLVDEVQRLYLADYGARWEAFINDLRLAPAPTLSGSAELANLLARPDSPLLAVLRAAVREVTIGPLPPPAGGAPDDPLGPHFDALRRFLTGQPPPVENMQALLGKLSAHLVAVEDAVKRRTLPPASDVTRELTTAAQRAPEPIHGMLSQLSATSAAQVFAALRDPLARQLASDVVPQCGRAVAGRYPLVRSSREEVSREEFASVFGSGGLMDGFFQRHLMPYVDTSTRPWAWRGADGAARAEGSESLQQFQRAQAIREAFFRDGGRRLGVRLDFRLIELDPGISEFTIDVDGQVLRFRPGAQTPQSLQWPGPGDAGRVHLQLTPSTGSGGPGYLFQGPWALFRLLDRVRTEPGSAPDRSQLVFDVEGRKARFEVRSPAALNPMARQDLEQFQCPKRL
jgi:type VI secretion system protein ImpL